MFPGYTLDHSFPGLNIKAAGLPDSHSANIRSFLFASRNDRFNHIPGGKTVNCFLIHQVSPGEAVFVQTGSLITAPAHGLYQEHVLFPAGYRIHFAGAGSIQAMSFGYIKPGPVVFCPATG
jgi:hypothetical protein